MWSSEATIFLHLHPDAGRFDMGVRVGGGCQGVLIPVPSAYTNVIIFFLRERCRFVPKTNSLQKSKWNFFPVRGIFAGSSHHIRPHLI